MNRGGVFLILAALALQPPAPGVAQNICRDLEPPDACMSRLWDDGIHDVRTDAAEAARSTSRILLHEKTAGLGAGIGGVLASAIENFLPRFAGSVAIDREDPEGGLMTAFELNLPAYGRPGAAVRPPRLGGALRIRAETREPRVFVPLLDAVSAEGLEALKERAGRELDDLDDLAIVVGWNRESRRYGRSFRANHGTVAALQDSILDMIPGPGSPQFPTELVRRMDADVAASGRARKPECGGGDFPQVRCLSPGMRSEVEAAVVEYLKAYRSYRATADSTFAAARFHQVADLINNQPQWNVTFQARLRDALVGPQEYRLEARYESGWVNMNGLREFCGDGLTARCFRNYLEDPGVRAILARSDRIWFSGQVRLIEDYDFRSSGPTDPPNLAVAGSLSIEVKGGYGRYLSVDELGTELARVDLVAEGLLHEDGSGRKDTWGVSAIYTHRVSDSFSLPVGLSYSNRDEFLEDVDHRVSANVGLHYRLIPNEP